MGDDEEVGWFGKNIMGRIDVLKAGLWIQILDFGFGS